MPKNPAYGLADAVGAHFDAAVLRPVRKTIDFANAVSEPIKDAANRGLEGVRRWINPPKKPPMGDIRLPTMPQKIQTRRRKPDAL